MESGIASFLLGALSLGAAILAAALGVILSYHWFNFSGNAVVSLVALTIYTTGCVALIIALTALAAAV
ncbi:hypothetical protein HYW60_03600 [Candidatus Kaiserbacteria bacterium]|nr:hypothetical protein [Candidatus Kaiserbacteria bacterium]